MTFDHTTRTRRRRPCAAALSLAALAAPIGAAALAQQPPAPVAVAPPAAEVVAQAQVAEQLPPIVVQGATIAPPKPARTAVDADPVAAMPAPAPKPKAKGTAAAKAQKSGPGGGAQPAAQDASSAAGAGSGGGSSAEAASSSDGDGVPLRDLGSAVSVVTGAELRAQQVRHAADALRSLPGVTVSRSGGNAGVTEVRIRGAESNHTLVLIDGIEVNNPVAGFFDFSDLLTDDIERIEVIRGPQSGLYGSNALGGVINVVTRSGRGPLTLRAAAEGGSFDSRAVAASVSAGTDRAWFRVTNQFNRADGFNVAPVGSEDDPYRINQLSLRAGAMLLPGLSLDFSVRNIRKTASRDAFDGPVGSLATAFDDASTFTTNLWASGAQLRWDMLGGALTHLVKASRVTNELVDQDVTSFFRSVNQAEADKLGYVLTYRFATGGPLAVRHVVSGLVERDEQSFVPLSDFADGIEKSRKQVAYAAEYQADIADRLALNGNIRRDDNDSFVDFTTWRVSAALKLPEVGMRPHASLGTGVRLPSMFEQYGFFGTFRPNPDAQPEESFGWDAGIEFSALAGRAILDVTYFDIDIENKITENDTFTGIINLPGTARRQGVEVSGRWLVSTALSLGASYTYLEATDPDGDQEPRRPEHAARFDIDYRFMDGRARINVATIYNGEMADRGLRVTGRAGTFPIFAAEPLMLDDYWLVSVAGSYAVAPGVELYGRVENALDQKYEEQEGYNTPGIAAYVGVRLTYEEPSTKDWVKYK